jgi:hypothetical protein
MQALIAVPRVQRVLARLNLIDGPTLRAPSYIYNTIDDQLAIIKPVDRFVAVNCARGAVVDYYRDPVGEHVSGTGSFVAPAMSYLQNRFDGKPPPNTCPPRRPASGGDGETQAKARGACASRRRVTIHVGRHGRIVHATVRINGRAVRARRRGRRGLRIDLRGRRSGTYRVVVAARLTGGRRVRTVRTYHTCRPHHRSAR